MSWVGRVARKGAYQRKGKKKTKPAELTTVVLNKIEESQKHELKIVSLYITRKV